MNTLYYGDNLNILRRYIKDKSPGAGFYHSDGWNKKYPRIQILTIEELLAGKQVDMPPSGITFKQATRISTDTDDQATLGFD